MSLNPAQKVEVDAAVTDYKAQHDAASNMLKAHQNAIVNANKGIEAANARIAALANRIAALQAACAA